MNLEIADQHVGWFRQLYETLGALADQPENTISRIGGGRILVAEDLANELDSILRCIFDTYPNAVELEVVRVAQNIDHRLGEYSLSGELFDPTFWTNAGFLRHDGWQDIRELARAFLIR